jgi:hypothetical protein
MYGGLKVNWTYCQSQSYVTTDGQSTSPSWNEEPVWGLRPDFYYCQDSCGFVDVGRLHWREDASVVYNCRWSSSAQSFSGQSPAGPVTTFYCLKFETFPSWRARSPYVYPQGTGWPGYTPRHWVPVSLLRWRYLILPPRRIRSRQKLVLCLDRLVYFSRRPPSYLRVKQKRRVFRTQFLAVICWT